MILELALPAPPISIIDNLLSFAQTLGHNSSSREWLKNYIIMKLM